VKVKLQEINLYKSGRQENNAQSTENTKYIYSSAFNDLNLYIPKNIMIYRKNNSMMFKGNSTVANPETMPPDLMKAHTELDRAVDACYGKTSFKNERERIEFLFALYEQYTKPLLNQ
jgi:hypothetical protein